MAYIINNSEKSQTEQVSNYDRIAVSLAIIIGEATGVGLKR
jgi:hypothetical protein